VLTKITSYLAQASILELLFRHEELAATTTSIIGAKVVAGFLVPCRTFMSLPEWLIKLVRLFVTKITIRFISGQKSVV